MVDLSRMPIHATHRVARKHACAHAYHTTELQTHTRVLPLTPAPCSLPPVLPPAPHRTPSATSEELETLLEQLSFFELRLQAEASATSGLDAVDDSLPLSHVPMGLSHAPMDWQAAPAEAAAGMRVGSDSVAAGGMGDGGAAGTAGAAAGAAGAAAGGGGDVMPGTMARGGTAAAAGAADGATPASSLSWSQTLQELGLAGMLGA